MSDLEKLKQIDIKEIQKKTRLTEQRINEIINKKFDSLDKVKAHGFISILEKEYDLDLSEWTNEYKKYWRDKEMLEYEANLSLQNIENDEKTKDKKSSNMNVESIKVDKNNRFKATYAIIAIIALTLILLIYFTATGGKKDTKKVVASPAKVEKSLEEIPLNSLSPDSSELESIQDMNKTSQNSPDSLIQDTTSPAPLAPLKKEIKSIHKIILIPRSDLWIGFVNLKTKKTTERIIPANTEYQLDIENKIAFKFGHSDLDINVDGNIQSYSDPKPSRFIYDPDSGFKKLTTREFNRIVGDTLWQ